MAYHKIRDSGLHAIPSWLAILPYTNAIKWTVDHTNPKDRSLNDSTGSQLATFRLEVLTRAYDLKLAVQPLNIEFSQSSKTSYNFNEILKSWMNEPSKFS